MIRTCFGCDAEDIFGIQDSKLAEYWDVTDIHGLFKHLGAIK